MRQAKAIRQTDLAYQAGLRPASVSELETGKNANPGWELLKRVCKTMDTTIHRLTMPDASSVPEEHYEEMAEGLKTLIQNQDSFLTHSEERISLEEAEWLRHVPCPNRRDLSPAVYLQLLRSCRIFGIRSEEN
jgi:transcriptional regulator with XRE-family HTH domain